MWHSPENICILVSLKTAAFKKLLRQCHVLLKLQISITKNLQKDKSKWWKKWKKRKDSRMYNWFLGPRKAVIFLWDFLCQEEGKRNENERGEKNGDPSIIKKEVALYSCKRCIFMNTSYGLETAPNEIKTFLQRLHNYAVVATHLVSYIGWRRRIKKKFLEKKKWRIR